MLTALNRNKEQRRHRLPCVKVPNGASPSVTFTASPDQLDTKNEAGDKRGNEYEQTLTAVRVCEEALGCKTVLCWEGQLLLDSAKSKLEPHGRGTF